MKQFLHVINQSGKWHVVCKNSLLSKAYASAVKHGDGFIVEKVGRKTRQVRVNGVSLSGHMGDINFGGLFCASEHEKATCAEVLQGLHD